MRRILGMAFECAAVLFLAGVIFLSYFVAIRSLL